MKQFTIPTDWTEEVVTYTQQVKVIKYRGAVVGKVILNPNGTLLCRSERGYAKVLQDHDDASVNAFFDALEPKA